MIPRKFNWESPSRYYSVVLAKDLFGCITLIKMWGGKDNKLNGQKIESYKNVEEVKQELREVFEKRQKRGYILKN